MTGYSTALARLVPNPVHICLSDLSVNISLLDIFYSAKFTNTDFETSFQIQITVEIVNALHGSTCIKLRSLKRPKLSLLKLSIMEIPLVSILFKKHCTLIYDIYISTKLLNHVSNFKTCLVIIYKYIIKLRSLISKIYYVMSIYI